MAVGLIQAAFSNGKLVEKCAWKAGVLIPKGNGDFHGTRLVKALFKTVIGILNCHLTAAIHFHDTLHGLCTVRGTGKDSLEDKLLQELMAMRKEFLSDIYLDIHKA